MSFNRFCSMSGDKTGTGPDDKDKETEKETPATDQN